MTHRLYEVLGVPQDAGKDDIKKAYKKMAVQYHPDKGGDPEKFKEIANAYDVLSDDNKRQMYDQLGDDRFNETGGGAAAGGGGPFGGVDPHSIFEQIFGGAGGFGFNVNMHDPFGGGGGGIVKKRNHLHELCITLDDAYRGVHKNIKVSLTKICGKCKEQCYACQGRGHVMDMRRMGFLTQMMQRPCDICSTTGFIAKGKSGCKECGGAGTVKDDHKIDVNLPSGVATGHHIVFKGLGEQAVGDNEVSGDLVFEVRVVHHNVFEREGADLHMTVPISFADSVVGKEVNVPHFGGEFVMNTREFGVINPMKTYTVRGKGMPGGNLVVHFNVNYPAKKLSDEEKECIVKAFGEIGI